MIGPCSLSEIQVKMVQKVWIASLQKGFFDWLKGSLIDVIKTQCPQ